MSGNKKPHENSWGKIKEERETGIELVAIRRYVWNIMNLLN